MSLMIKTIQATKLRNNFKDALDHVKESKQPLIITERGVPTSVLVDIDEFEDYLMMQDKKFVSGLHESIKQKERGETRTLEEVFAEFD
jgi:prevent-host-death family protein